MTTATEVGYVEMRIAKVVGVHAAQDEVVRCGQDSRSQLISRAGCSG